MQLQSPYSSYKTEGYKDAAHQLGILLFPVFISTQQYDFGKYKLQLLEIFGLSCTITIFIYTSMHFASYIIFIYPGHHSWVGIL